MQLKIILFLFLLFQTLAVNWQYIGQVNGLPGTTRNEYVADYTPVVIINENLNYYYPEGNGSGNLGSMFLYQGSWFQVSKGVNVLSKNQLYDVGSQGTIKTHSVQRLLNGSCIALLHVGAPYPHDNLYVPAWATSPNCISNWQYEGKVNILNGTVSNARSANLIVQEEYPILNHVNPIQNKFLAWEDQVFSNGIGYQLALIYSDNGHDWWIYPVDVNPEGAARFVTGARTEYGYHLMIADGSPSTKLVHKFSCNGLDWTVLEDPSPIWSYPKGVNFVYSNGIMHSYDGGTRQHWQYQEQSFPCN